MLPKLGPVRLRKLMEVFADPQDILKAPAHRLAAVDGISSELARRISAWEDEVDLTAETDRIRDAGVHVITSRSDHYPGPLLTIHDPPIVLYVWGDLTSCDSQGVGVVGSRRTSFYGTETAKKLAYQIAFAGFTIYSGLARGIDTAAHQGALAAKGRTVGVLGCGLSQIYPPENFALAERIAEGNGAVISEFPMSVTPDRQTFPMRNRIISGSSLGLLVIEAGLNSGALISAGQAADQGRIVFAVPGPIDRETSQGTNRLIQQGAKLVMDSADVLEEISALPGFISPTLPPSPASNISTLANEPKNGGEAPPSVAARSATPAAYNAPTGLKPDELAVYEAVGQDETPVDQVILNCGLPTSTVSSTLFALELKKLIKQLPGKHYVRLA